MFFVSTLFAVCFVLSFFFAKTKRYENERKQNQAHKHIIPIESSLENKIDRMDSMSVPLLYMLLCDVKHLKLKQIGSRFSRICTDDIAIFYPFFTHAPNWIQKQLQSTSLYRLFKWQSVKPQKFNMIFLDWTATTTTEKSQCDDFQSMGNGSILFFDVIVAILAHFDFHNSSVAMR